MDTKDVTRVSSFGSGSTPIVQVANDVIGTIAALAASDAQGVVGMAGGFVGDIVEMLGKKSLSKGVKVDVREKTIYLDLYLVVRYGSRIPDVATAVQENVKDRVEHMTGLIVGEINIHVQGVSFQQGLRDDDHGTSTETEELNRGGT